MHTLDQEAGFKFSHSFLLVGEQ